MELPELKVIIYKALKRCQRKLKEQPAIVLTEADFERLVSWSIMKELNQNNYKKVLPSDFTVHSQITHHKGGEFSHNRRPDLLLLTEEGMSNANTSKGFIYEGNSFAIELKYIRLNDSDYANKIRKDFNKRKEIYANSWLYVVVLIETDENTDYKAMKNRIEKMRTKMVHDNEVFEESLHCYVLKKRKVVYDTF